jgi:capsular polysaccharide export protein
MDLKSSHKYIKNNKYIFYPVQVPSESRITVRADAYHDQGWIIEYLSRNMPYEYDLVVKDHPYNVGLLPKRTINVINRCAIGVNPELQAWDVANSAEAIVVLNNTVGFESVLQQKPVVVLGDGFYSGCGYTFDVNQLGNVKHVLNDAVNSRGLNDKKLIEFVHGIKNASWPGIYHDHSENNVEKLTDSIVEFTRNRLKRAGKDI